MSQYDSTHIDIEFSFSIVDNKKYIDNKKPPYHDYVHLQSKTRYDNWLFITKSIPQSTVDLLKRFSINRKSVIILSDGTNTVPVYIKTLETDFIRLQSILSEFSFVISYENFAKYISTVMPADVFAKKRKNKQI
jgi:hypothetical protein